MGTPSLTVLPIMHALRAFRITFATRSGSAGDSIPYVVWMLVHMPYIDSSIADPSAIS